MAADADQIDRRDEVFREFSEALGGVDVEVRGRLAEDSSEFADGLDDTRLVVDVHERHEQGVRAQALADMFDADPAVLVGLEEVDLETAALQVLERFEDRFVLDRRGDDVPAPGLLAVRRDPEQRDVVALGCAACEDQLFGGRAELRSELRTRLLYCFLGARTVLVSTAASVAEVFGHPVEHDISDAWVDARGRGCIKVRYRHRYSFCKNPVQYVTEITYQVRYRRDRSTRSSCGGGGDVRRLRVHFSCH